MRRFPRIPVVAGLLFAGLSFAHALQAVDPVERIVLDNDRLRFEFTPQLGGRGLAFSVPGQPNLLRVGAAVENDPVPVVAANGRNYPYLGHIVWVGPQQDWWRQQSVNPDRRAAGAVWPPDPWLVLAPTEQIDADKASAELLGPASPVSGLELSKRFVLEGGTLTHRVEAVNMRDEPVAWDLWFNTRIAPETRVLVPVSDPEKYIRLETFDGPGAAPDVERLRAGYFDFARGGTFKAKAFIQPAAGWIAAFTRGQLFVIEFDRQPAGAIHPDHGQVELYIDSNPESGLLELEVHAPYRTLAPRERMGATERWRAWPSTAASLREQMLELDRRGYALSASPAPGSR